MRGSFRLLRAILASRMLKFTTLAVGCLTCDSAIRRLTPSVNIQCWGGPNLTTSQKIQDLLSKAIVIKNADEKVIGYAYCIAPDIFVTSSPQVYNYDEVKTRTTFDCYLQKPKSTPFNKHILGRFDNFTFLIIKNTGISPIQGVDPILFGKVTLVNKKQYPQVKNGYFVHRQSGYGFTTEAGSVGALVTVDGVPSGLVSQVGRSENEEKLCMFVQWKKLKNLVHRLQVNQTKPFLGISVKNLDKEKGSLVTKVTSDSPFKKFIALGDVIKKIDGQDIGDCKDIVSMVAFGGKSIEFTIDRDGKETSFSVQI